MARDAIAFLDALELGAVDLLGFSLGSFVAQEIALIRPAVVRRVVLASAAPRGAAGMHGWAPEATGAVGEPAPNADGYLGVLFTRSAASRQAGVETLGRQTARSDDRDKLASWQTRQAQYDAVGDSGIPDHGRRAGQRERDARVRGRRRQRPDDPAALLLPARRPDPAGAGEDLPRRRARVPVSAPRRVCPRRRRLPHGVRSRLGRLAPRRGRRPARLVTTPC